MKWKVFSFYILILSWALYDRLVIYGWNTNLVVFYYSTFYLFILFWMYQTFKMIKNVRESIYFLVLAWPVFFRLILTLLSINHTREQYNNLVNNQYLDFATWGILIIFLINQTWKKLQRLRQC